MFNVLNTRLLWGRAPPDVIIVDTDMNGISWSPGSGAPALIGNSSSQIRETVRACCERNEQMVHVVNDNILLRIVPLRSYSVKYAMIMIESFGSRGSLDKAAQAFHLTRREVEILECVVHGMSNAEIAKALHIAQSTVGDHVKSLMRKANTTKRIQLVNKIAYGDVAD